MTDLKDNEVTPFRTGGIRYFVKKSSRVCAGAFSLSGAATLPPQCHLQLPGPRLRYLAGVEGCVASD
jgi:hypothetical protein